MAFFIVSDQGGVVIDVTGAKPKAGTPLQVYGQKSGDNDNQLWSFEAHRSSGLARRTSGLLLPQEQTEGGWPAPPIGTGGGNPSM